MSHVGTGYDINQTFIIEPLDNGIPILSACTALYTNNILSCSGNTQIFLGDGIITFDGNLYTNDNLSANTINASTYYSGGTNLIDIVSLNSITGGTFNNNTDTLTLYKKNNSTVVVTGFTDYYTTGATLIGDTVYFDRNDHLSAYTVNLSSLVVNDKYVTGVTFTNNQLIIARNDGVNLNTFINTFTGLTINGTLNVDAIRANTISATTISATTLYGDGSHLTGLVAQDTRVTGFTYTPNTFTIYDTTGGTYSASFNEVSGLTISGQLLSNSISANTISATTFYGDGSHLTGLVTQDTYVTGGTYSNGSATFTNNTGGTFNVTGFYTGYTAPTDIYVTGATYSNGSATFTNNTGGTFTVTGFTLPYTFTGGTVTGDTIFTGSLSASTISATTYHNLPIDIHTTGVTYSNNAFTFTNNTGGTYSVIFDTVTGLTATTLSASTYLGLPTDVYVTGATYSNGSVIFTNNTGGTFNVTGFYTGYTAPIDVYVTGGTYSSGITTFTNNTGGTFTVSGYYTGYTAPIDVYVTGGTYSSGITTFTNNTGGTFNVSGFTTSNGNSSYLPLSGGTVTGNTIFTSGLTANTLNVTNYIDFNTGTTTPANISGRVYYDKQSHSLAYFPDITQNVKVEMGQQLYIRGYNATGSLIPKGSALSIQSATNGLPNFTLAVNVHAGHGQVVGLAASDIPNASNGLALSQGILSGLTLNTFGVGDILYVSPFSAGTYVAGTSSFPYTARTNQIGYVIDTGTSTGEIYVSINNEDENVSLTDIERNILEGNVVSSGVYNYTGMTQGTGQTINIASINGWVANNTYAYATKPDVYEINYSGGTNIPLTYLNTADATYILITSASTIFQQNTFPTPQQRRQNIYLGKVVHPNRATITSINQTVDFDVSPMAAIRDLWTPLKLINQGIIPSPNGVNLTINTSAGTLWGNGIGWVTNQLNPDSVSISGTSPTTFQYRTQLGPITGGTAPYTGNTTFIDPAHYDNNGVVTNVGGGSNSSTNQRIYIFPTGLVRIQYGQTVYSNLAAAVAGSQTESFVEYSNNRDNGILIGILSVNKNATQLNNSAQAVFNLVSKFGELLGGTGGLSTTTLQQAYDNSTTPEILINSTIDGLTIQNGTGNADATTHLLEGQNTAGATTSFITAAGGFSGSSVSALTITTPSVTAKATGLSATTISATTYQNLPTDIKTTGATYNNNTFTFTNNTGGTYSVLFNAVTGLTATTLSASTYLGLPTDIRVTGGTYSNGITTFTNNTGGTFTVNGFYTGSTDIRVTGGTYSSGTATFTNNTGGTFTVTGFSTSTVINRSFGIVIDGGGSAITTGTKTDAVIPYNMTITGWTMIADTTGSTIVDVWKTTYAGFPPTSGNTITGSQTPTINNNNKGQSTSVSGWTTTVTAGDIARFYVSSASTITKLTLSIQGTTP